MKTESAIVSEELRQALGSILEAGYQLSVDGFEYLKTLEVSILQETVKKALYQASRAEADIDFVMVFSFRDSRVPYHPDRGRWG